MSREVGIVDWALLCFGFLWQICCGLCCCSIIRMFTQSKDERKKVEQALESMCYPCSKVSPVIVSWWVQAIMFCYCYLFLFSFFSAPNIQLIRGRSVDCHQILTYVRWRSEFTKLGLKFGAPPHKNLAVVKHQDFGQISDNFLNWSRIYSARNKISSNGKRRCKLQSLYMHT